MEPAQWKTALDTILQDQEASMLALLEELVGIDSPTAHADGVNRMGERLTAWLGEAGFQVRRLPKPPVPEDEAWQKDLGDVFTARTHAPEAGPGIAFIITGLMGIAFMIFSGIQF